MRQKGKGYGTLYMTGLKLVNIFWLGHPPKKRFRFQLPNRPKVFSHFSNYILKVTLPYHSVKCLRMPFEAKKNLYIKFLCWRGSYPSSQTCNYLPLSFYCPPSCIIFDGQMPPPPPPPHQPQSEGPSSSGPITLCGHH